MLQPSPRSRYATAPDGASISLQQECDVRASPSDQPGTVWSHAQLDHAVREPTMFERVALSSRGKARVARIGAARCRSAPARRWRIRDEEPTQQAFLALWSSARKYTSSSDGHPPALFVVLRNQNTAGSRPCGGCSSSHRRNALRANTFLKVTSLVSPRLNSASGYQLQHHLSHKLLDILGLKHLQLYQVRRSFPKSSSRKNRLVDPSLKRPLIILFDFVPFASQPLKPPVQALQARVMERLLELSLRLLGWSYHRGGFFAVHHGHSLKGCVFPAPAACSC